MLWTHTDGKKRIKHVKDDILTFKMSLCETMTYVTVLFLEWFSEAFISGFPLLLFSKHEMEGNSAMSLLNCVPFDKNIHQFSLQTAKLCWRCKAWWTQIAHYLKLHPWNRSHLSRLRDGNNKWTRNLIKQFLSDWEDNVVTMCSCGAGHFLHKFRFQCAYCHTSFILFNSTANEEMTTIHK